MSLPTQPVVNTKDTMRPELLRALIYALPGAGKTTFAGSWFPETNLILECDPGGARFLPGQHFIHPCPTYADFAAAVDEIEAQVAAGTCPYTTVTIDTGDSLFRTADNEAGERHGKVAAGLADFGKGTEDRDATFLRHLKRLLATPLGVLLLAHPDITTIKLKDSEISSYEPRVVRKSKNDIRQEIVGLFDYQFFIRKDDHVLITGGDPLVATKRRLPLPDQMPADAGTLYQALIEGAKTIAAAPAAA